MASCPSNMWKPSIWMNMWVSGCCSNTNLTVELLTAEIAGPKPSQNSCRASQRASWELPLLHVEQLLPPHRHHAGECPHLGRQRGRPGRGVQSVWAQDHRCWGHQALCWRSGGYNLLVLLFHFCFQISLTSYFQSNIQPHSSILCKVSVQMATLPSTSPVPA